MTIFNNDKKSFYLNPLINKLIITLFFISLLLIPFDDLPYFNALGGLGKRASIYPFLLMVPIIILVFFQNRKIFYKNCIENNLIFAFYISCIISVLFNITVIHSSVFKGQTGIKRAIIQIGSISLLLLSMYAIQFIINKNKLSIITIRKFICLSFIPVAIIGMLQLLNLLKIYDFSYIIQKSSYFINNSLRGDLYGTRIRGVSAEASYLGMYCAFLFPWFFSYILTEKKKISKVIFSVISFIILALVVATKSRTATILIFVDLFVILVLILLFYKSIRVKIFSSFMIVLMGIFLFGFSSSMDYLINRPKAHQNNSQHPSNTVNNYQVGQLISSISDNNIDSNIARKSMQKAAFKIGLDNPVLGVGIGQFGFHLNNYLDKDAFNNSHEVRVWSNNEVSTWPPVHSLYHRIFAEEGSVGLLLYLLFIIIICLKLFIKIITNKNNLFGIILLSSYGTILIGQLTLDQFVIPQFWIMTSIIILYNNDLITLQESI
ncbi:MAG: O-antigen ligase family protein [Clostridium septicum]|uniref:O-antigen ligase family protein n=1 Tax=Clostridium septicum TaxID=1504 RepID=UPI002590F79D|nr:O-antigen ligase family protein [Clostridium septicum]MDU1315394.1 O-antigen ligase family protein [Clostridium septicum]